eukprot:TRINITY_DN34601_c0_g1_i1.p1 TRINITY_DN34601_c0_g1~~TRINITY_DN34601_c0_g1_i1.p1  ORF type:complete len:777 (+),score=136.41 TRINITY_DN34601_c0_g1_i1:86-2416(+)
MSLPAGVARTHFDRGPGRNGVSGADSIGAISSLGSEFDDDDYKDALYDLPCDVRKAAAEMYPAGVWSRMTWKDRWKSARWLSQANVDATRGSATGAPSNVARSGAAASASAAVPTVGRGGGGGGGLTNLAPGGGGVGLMNVAQGGGGAGLTNLAQGGGGGVGLRNLAQQPNHLHPPPPRPPTSTISVASAASTSQSAPYLVNQAPGLAGGNLGCLGVAASAASSARPSGAAGGHHAAQGSTFPQLGHAVANGRQKTREQRARLKLIFDTSDGLQVAIGHHTQQLVLKVVDAMKLRTVARHEVVLYQGQLTDCFFIVEAGNFDVLVKENLGRDAPAIKICEYGPGSVFGEQSLISNAPRGATVLATTSASVWTLDRTTFEEMLRAPADRKTINLVGGVMLLINNLAGPTIVSMPALAQQAGWLPLVVVQAVVAAFATACGFMLIEAMRAMPGNERFEQTIEFTNLALYYLPHSLYVFVMGCYHVNSILNLMSLIIQSAQVIDYVMVNVNGCAPGLEFSGRLRYVCASRTDSVTPFGDVFVLSGAMLTVAAVCAPFAMKNLDDNVDLQYAAVAGLGVMAVIWIGLLVEEPAFPTQLPMATSSQGSLVGTVLFNFAFTSTLPSWVNEKRPDVSVAASFATTMVFVVCLYSLIGIIGGMAYAPFYDSDENLFSKLNASGSMLGRTTVALYPMLQNVTSIPVLAILIRYNLIQGGLPRDSATIVAVVLPWVMSVPFYTGRGFDTISEVGGLATSSVINFIVPALMYVVAVGRLRERRNAAH